MNGARVLVVSSLDGWRDQWDDLVLQAPLPSPFLRSWWLESVSERPRFSLVVEGEALLGGMALERRRVGLLRPWVVPGPVALTPDHVDLVSRPDEVGRVSAALRGEWRRRGRLVDLAGLHEDAVIGATLGGRPARRVGAAPYLPLPETVEAMHGRLGRRFLQDVRRHARRLEAEGVVHRVVTGEKVDRQLADLRRLHVLRWGNRSDFASVFEEFARAARAGAARGEVLFHELVHSPTDEVIATSVILQVGGRTSGYQAGRLQDRRFRGSGTVLVVRVLEHAIASGCHELDFLRGNEPYKAEFTAQARLVYRRIGRLGPLAWLPATLWDTAIGARARAEQHAKRLRGRGPEPTDATEPVESPPEFNV